MQSRDLDGLGITGQLAKNLIKKKLYLIVLINFGFEILAIWQTLYQDYDKAQ